MGSKEFPKDLDLPKRVINTLKLIKLMISPISMMMEKSKLKLKF